MDLVLGVRPTPEVSVSEQAGRAELAESYDAVVAVSHLLGRQVSVLGRPLHWCRLRAAMALLFLFPEGLNPRRRCPLSVKLSEDTVRSSLGCTGEYSNTLAHSESGRSPNMTREARHNCLGRHWTP